jgi:hypothetical protein
MSEGPDQLEQLVCKPRQLLDVVPEVAFVFVQQSYAGVLRPVADFA